MSFWLLQTKQVVSQGLFASERHHVLQAVIVFCFFFPLLMPLSIFTFFFLSQLQCICVSLIISVFLATNPLPLLHLNSISGFIFLGGWGGIGW